MEERKKYLIGLFGGKQVPQYILEKRNVIRMILFTTLYSLVFINIFRPFNSEEWIPNSTSMNYFMYSSLMVLIGMIVISLSRLAMRLVSRRFQLDYTEYVLWLILEAFMLAAFYVFIAYKVGFVNNYIQENKDATTLEALFDIYIRAAVNTIWMLLIPYGIALLYLDNENLRNNSERLKRTMNVIQFRDQRGEVRFSTAMENVFFIESADNYVSIKYINNGTISDFILRNRIKNVEDDLAGTPLKRCHRSYIINLMHVKTIKHDIGEINLEFDNSNIKGITVTKTYQESIVNAFSEYSGQKQSI